MKKIVCTGLLLLVLLTGCANKSSKSDTVKKTDESTKASVDISPYINCAKAVENSQMENFDKTSTVDLLKTLMDSSSSTALLHNDIRGYLEHLDYSTDVYRELLRRNDLSENLFKMYTDKTYFDTYSIGARSVVEVLLSTDLVFNSLNDEQRKQICEINEEKKTTDENTYDNIFLSAIDGPQSFDFTGAEGWGEYFEQNNTSLPDEKYEAIKQYIYSYNVPWKLAVNEEPDKIVPAEKWFVDGKFVFSDDIYENMALGNTIRNYVLQEVLDKASTEDLLKAIMNNGSSGANPTGDYIRLLHSCTNMLQELLIREDMPECVYKKYIENNYGGFDVGARSVVEVLLSTDLVFNSLNDEQRKAVLEQAQKETIDSEESTFFDIVKYADYTDEKGWKEYISQ